MWVLIVIFLVIVYFVGVRNFVDVFVFVGDMGDMIVFIDRKSVV